MLFSLEVTKKITYAQKNNPQFFSRPDPAPTQPPIQWVQGTLSLGLKRLGREANHSPPSSTEVKECVEL
jgi:hypothetical protein